MRPSLSSSSSSLSLVLVLLLAAFAPARAQVAVVATLPEPDPGQRDVAAGIVAVAGERWQLLSPPLDPDVTAACKTDTACMLQAARARGASHLLVVGVAGVGLRDHVVSLQLLDAAGRMLLDNTAIVPGGGVPVDVGAGAAAVLAHVDGPPRATTTKTTPATIATTSATSAWTVAGVALVAAGAVTATSTTVATLLGAVPTDDAPVVVVAGASAATLLAVLGVACVVVDD